MQVMSFGFLTTATKTRSEFRCICTDAAWMPICHLRCQSFQEYKEHGGKNKKTALVS